MIRIEKSLHNNPVKIGKLFTKEDAHRLGFNKTKKDGFFIMLVKINLVEITFMVYPGGYFYGMVNNSCFYQHYNISVKQFLNLYKTLTGISLSNSKTLK